MRLIDADKLPRHGGRGGIVHWSDIEKAPTVDAMPVVRCKDCKFAKLIDDVDDWYECWHDKRVMHGDGFCSWAEGEEK